MYSKIFSSLYSSSFYKTHVFHILISASTQGARHAVFGISLSVFLSVSVSETIINFQWTGAQLQFDDDCLFLVVLPGGRVLYAISQDTGVQIYTFFTCQVCYKRETGAINKVLYIKSLEFCTKIHIVQVNIYVHTFYIHFLHTTTCIHCPNLKPTRIETKIHVVEFVEFQKRVVETTGS